MKIYQVIPFKSTKHDRNLLTHRWNIYILTIIPTVTTKVKWKGRLPLELFLVYCKTFRKKTKGLEIKLQWESSTLKGIINYTFLGGNAISVTIRSLFFYIPNIYPVHENNKNFTNPLVSFLLYQVIHGLLLKNQLTQVKKIRQT